MHTNQFDIDDLHILTLHTGYAIQESDWNWKDVHSPFARLYYVTEGNAQVIFYSSLNRSKEEIVNLRPGHLYFIPPFSMHRYVCEGHFAHYYIHILDNSANDLHYLTDNDFPREMKAESVDLALFKTLCDNNQPLKLPESNPNAYDQHHLLMRNISLNQKRPFFNKVESRGILYILMSRFIRHATPKSRNKDERILQSIAYIRKNISAPLRVSELADIASMSKDHFIRMFNQETGETPVEFITRQRMEHAERLLVTSDMSIKNIAQTLGFDDASYFNRIFKKYIGVTPNQYRRSSI